MKIDRRWQRDEDEILRQRYDRYGDAERLSPWLQNRSVAAIIKRANFLGIKTRRADGAAYTSDELASKTWKDENGCWNWMLDKRPAGYGVVKHAGKRVAAHRLMFELSFPDISIEGLLVCHHCDNPACINPEHMYAGTYMDNSRDMVVRGRLRNQYGPPKR